MWLLMGLGAIGGGLFLTLREILPWFAAQRSGVIRTRGARSEKISRAVDPERFNALARRRLKAAAPGSVVIQGGAAWLALNIVALLARAPVPPPLP